MELEEIQKRTIAYLESQYFKTEEEMPEQLWGSCEARLTKYKEIVSMADFNDSSLLDVGCGYCDFYEFLTKYKQISLRSYRGIDLHEKVVREAQKKHPELNNDTMLVQCEDILTFDMSEDSFDYCVGVGIFPFEIEEWTQRTEKMLRKMFKLAKKGVIVDFLKDREKRQKLNGHILPPKNLRSHYCKMSEAVRIAEKIAPYVNLKNDRRFNSFCLGLFKKEQN